MRVLWISFIAVLTDQVTKTLVVRHMYQHQSIPLLGDWLKLTYLENPGMAFGISFGPPAMISIFSIIATFLIVLYLFKVRTGYLPYRASIGLVLGGAFGNIIDRVFYGAIFYDNPIFQGRVVDFIHFDVWRGVLPEWVPFSGGNTIALFPIWNVADMAIVIGVVGILFFQKKFHAQLAEALAPEDSDDSKGGPLDQTAQGAETATVAATYSENSHQRTPTSAESAARKLDNHSPEDPRRQSVIHPAPDTSDTAQQDGSER